METKYYVNSSGDYLGGFCGSEPPDGSVEVLNPPAHGLDKWENGVWVSHVPVISKQELLASITVTTQAGNTFDGNETAIARMSNAIMVAERIGQNESEWKMADNTKVIITLDELKEAHTLAMMRLGEIVLAN